MALIEGLIIGFSLIILIGPVLFVLINSTITSGQSSGVAVALGIFSSDLIIVSVCLRWSTGMSISPLLSKYLALLGGIVLLFMGIRYYWADPAKLMNQPSISATNLLSFFLQGVAVNLINPFVFLVWLGIIATAKSRYPMMGDHLWLLGGTLIGILSLDLSKVFLAHRIRRFLHSSQLKRLQKLSGVCLILFSIRLFYLSI